MKLFSFVLISLFALVGAHVPKAFSLFYLAMLMSWLMSRQLDQRPLPPLPMDRSRLLRTVQVLVLLFSCTYPLAMLHFGFWQLSGRQLLDVVNAAVLPSALLWWGAYWARRDLRLFVACLLSYGLGGLVFLVAALLKTRGLSWFGPQLDPGSLFMAWGSEPSMNVRSIEQNGILIVALAPVALMLLFRRYYFLGLSLFCSAVLALSALLATNGRLWIVSLLLATWPFVGFGCRSLRRFLASSGLRGWMASGIGLMAVAAVLSVLWHFQWQLCDERFDIYLKAFQHWPQLIAGGRTLSYETLSCDGSNHLFLSTRGAPWADFAMMHNVLFDVLASVGLVSSLPLIIVLLIASFQYLCLLLSWLKPASWKHTAIDFYSCWCFLAVVVPQWLFQPLIYGDGLLYYLSYASLGMSLVIEEPCLLPGRHPGLASRPVL